MSPRAPLPKTLLPTKLRPRTAVAATLAVVLAWVSAAPSAAHYPIGFGSASVTVTKQKHEKKHHHHRRHRSHRSHRAHRNHHRRAHHRVRHAKPGSIGYDISFPQCRRHLPRHAAFRIVGVNGGRAFTTNRCLGAGRRHSELRWAGRHAWLYVNTGSPGHRLSRRWPLGEKYPRRCSRAHPLSISCAYDYGWYAARHSYRTAVRAYISLGWAPRGATRTPVRNRWWLDVETGNSWRWTPRLNVATLRGAVDFLESRRVASIGFYSAKFMWADITGRTRAFADYPSWVAGASTLRGARRYCSGRGFTRGGVELSQFPRRGFDGNVAC